MSNVTCNKTLSKNIFQKIKLCFKLGQLRSFWAEEHEEKRKSGENSGSLKFQHLWNWNFTTLFIFIVFFLIHRRTVSLLSSLPEFKSWESAQNTTICTLFRMNVRQIQLRKANLFESLLVTKNIFSVSFVTRMPGSTESSISSLGDCEVKTLY